MAYISDVKSRFFSKTRGLSPLFKRFFAVLALISINFAFCMGSDLHFQLWASLDAYPESSQAQDEKAGKFDYPVQSMKEVAPFLVEGMVYGWNFSYTPSDKARNVSENFELEPVQPEPVILPNLTYEDPWISYENNRLNCWIRFKKDTFQQRNYELWSSVQNPCISGRGYGSIEKGFEGIRDAVSNAVKEAVREYYRNEIKNKPKEITGAVLIRKEPVIGVVSGRYVVQLDFFLEKGKIIPYSVF